MYHAFFLVAVSCLSLFSFGNYSKYTNMKIAGTGPKVPESSTLGKALKKIDEDRLRLVREQTRTYDK
jgi:hypothetical protein